LAPSFFLVSGNKSLFGWDKVDGLVGPANPAPANSSQPCECAVEARFKANTTTACLAAVRLNLCCVRLG